MAKKVWNQAGALGAVNWALSIAKDNSFTYGPKPATSQPGCYFCKTNGGKVRENRGRYYSYGGHKFDIRKTYVCVTFIGAAYAHGAKDPTMLKFCKSDRLPITENNDNFSGSRGKCWKLIARGSAMASAKMLPGDVIVKYNARNQSPGHVCMYAGNDVIVESTSAYGAGSIKAIATHKGAKKRVKSYAYGNNFIMRYCGKGKGDGIAELPGTKELKLNLFFKSIEKAARQFYKHNTTYKSKCDSTAGHIRKTVNSSGFISQGIFNYVNSIEDKTAYPEGSSFSMGDDFTSCEVFESRTDKFSMKKLNKSSQQAVKDGDVKKGDICGFFKNDKQFIMVYAGKSKKGDLLWYSFGAAGAKKNKGVKEWKNAEKPRKRGDYGNIRTVVRIKGLDEHYTKGTEGVSSTVGGGAPSNVRITGFYEFYSGQENSQVISFSPELVDISAHGGDWLVSDANSIDEVRNEIISLSLGKNSYKNGEVLKDGQSRILGKSSSSIDSLSKKATSMWEKNFARQYTATMEVMGDTGVRVGTWIYIDVYTKYGLRHHTSGIYYVEEAEDSISDGSFTTSLQLRRHGYYDQYQQGGSSSMEGDSQQGSGDGSFPIVGSEGIEGMIEWAEKIADDDKWIYKTGDANCPICNPKSQKGSKGWVCTTFCRGAINHGMFKESNKYWKEQDKKGLGGRVSESSFEAMLKKGGFSLVKGEAQRGDILVRPGHHAMIYKGDNKIVHASTPKKGILNATLGYSWSQLRIYRYKG